MNALQLIVALVRDLNIPAKNALRLVNTAPHQYRHYQIPKRTGGMRDIYHPTPALKSVQRWLCSKVFSSLPVHDAVHSYREGRNIRSHAELHVDSNYLLRLDFVDFFPSLDKYWLIDFLRQSVARGHFTLNDDAIKLISRLVCRFSEKERSMALSIGAPSSPSISNAILFDLDSAISEASSRLGCTYTRYADDLYISCREPQILGELEVVVRNLVKEMTPKLAINEAKSLRVSRKTKRVVTGLILTPDRSISLGRDRKRSIRTKVYLYQIGQLSGEESTSLAGLLAFANDVEPRFIESLRHKFGMATIDALSFLGDSRDSS